MLASHSFLKRSRLWVDVDFARAGLGSPQRRRNGAELFAKPGLREIRVIVEKRFVKSCYVLAVVAVVWMGGIVLLDLAYVRPSFKSQARRAEQQIAGGWLRLTQYFIQDCKDQMLHNTMDLDRWLATRGRFNDTNQAPRPIPVLAEWLKEHNIPTAAFCDAQRRVIWAWTVGPDGRLTQEQRLPPGKDLSELGIFRHSRADERAAGLSQTPLGPAVFARCAARPTEGAGPVGSLVTIGPMNDSFFAELSAMVGASVNLKEDPKPFAEADELTPWPSVRRTEDRSLLAAKPLRFSTGELAGYLLVRGRAASTYWQSRALANALTTSLVWGTTFAVLMILVIHLLVSGPTAKLLKRLERLQSGRSEEDLSAGLRGEALGLAKRFEQVLGRIEKLSETDSLTGLSNRRSFQQAFAREFQRARRYHRPLALAIMDVDFLKAANDVLGHQTGDLILQVFVKVVLDSVRTSDLTARLGGDEFAVLMPEADGQQAAAVVERIRASFAVKSIGRGEVKISPTVSIGVADLTAAQTDTPGALFNLTDKALYTAKRAGRNRVVCATELDDVAELADGDRERKLNQLASQLAGLDAKFKRLFVEAIGGLISALEARDQHTANHSEKVRYYATLIAREMKLHERSIEHIGRAAILHDIGKIGLPDTVLLKEGLLNDQEWQLVKRHPVISVHIMEGMEFLDQEIPTVRHHHERYDGGGYPEGLSASSIPLGARILLVADAFVAMTSSRTYRDSMSVERALDELRRGSGAQFDPAVVSAFLKVAERSQASGQAFTVAQVAAPGPSE